MYPCTCFCLDKTCFETERKEEKTQPETRMTASILKRDPNTQKIKKNTIHWDKTQHTNFRGNPFYEATKQHLNNC